MPQYWVLLMASPESCTAGLALSNLIPNGNEALCSQTVVTVHAASAAGAATAAQLSADC